MAQFSHFKSYVKPPLPQLNADPQTGIVPLNQLTFQGDECNFSHNGYGQFKCTCEHCKVT